MPRKKSNRRPLQITLPPVLIEETDTKALESGSDRSHFIEHAIRAYLKQLRRMRYLAKLEASKRGPGAGQSEPDAGPPEHDLPKTEQQTTPGQA